MTLGHTPVINHPCSAVRHVLDLVGDKWSVFVVGTLGDGPKRFNELKRMVDGISQRMLTLPCADSNATVWSPVRFVRPCLLGSTTLSQTWEKPCSIPSLPWSNGPQSIAKQLSTPGSGSTREIIPLSSIKYLDKDSEVC